MTELEGSVIISQLSRLHIFHNIKKKKIACGAFRFGWRKDKWLTKTIWPIASNMLELASPVNTRINLWHAYVDSLRKDRYFCYFIIWNRESKHWLHHDQSSWFKGLIFKSSSSASGSLEAVGCLLLAPVSHSLTEKLISRKWVIH